jgi:hypothetical protein
VASNIYNVEWLEQNELRNYPLYPDASGVDVSLTFTLPTEFLVELHFLLQGASDADPTLVYIKEIGVYSAGFVISLGYNDGSARTIATAVVNGATHTEYSSYVLAGIGEFSDCTGKVVVGRLDEINLQPAGRFTFNPVAGQLDPDCIRSFPRGVTGFLVDTGSGSTSVRLQGDITLIAGSNIRFTPVLLSGVYQLRIDAISGEGLNEVCACAGGLASGIPITSIAGVAPASDGSFSVLGDACLTVTPIANGLQLADVCSAPCLGCADAANFAAELSYLRDQLLSLQNFINNVSGEMNVMTQTVIASKLNDSGCVACS